MPWENFFLSVKALNTYPLATLGSRSVAIALITTMTMTIEPRMATLNVDMSAEVLRDFLPGENTWVAGYNAHIADGKENTEDQYSSVDQQKTNIPETSVDETIKQPMRLEQCQLVIRQLPDQGKGRNFLLAGQSCERLETKYSLGCNCMHCGVQIQPQNSWSPTN